MKHILFLLLSSVMAIAASAATFPSVSTQANPIWYFLKFQAGGYVIATQGENAIVKTAEQNGDATQYWRLEGDDSQGYSLISKSGLKLYSNTTQRDGKVYAAASPTSSNTRFAIQTQGTGFTISPKQNTGVFMNQWTGFGLNKEIGLWSSADANSVLQFVSQVEYENELKLASLPLVPMPQSISVDGGSKSISSITSVAYPSETYATLARQYATMLGKISGVSLTTSQAGSGASIVLKLDSGVAGDEAYRIASEGGSIVVSASAPHGFFNALQTLRQLFYDARINHDGEMQLVTISDQPQLGYRGFMLDIARHFFDKEEVKKLLDVMALYKVNRFHWHLTDDQGWRIEIPEYPRLTQVGTIRSRSNTKSSPQFYDDTEYGRGMYYTLADLREIVDYATALHIDILPEVDLPGHMVAAIASYPELLACSATPIEGSSYQVRVDAGVSKDVLNVAKPEVMDFIKCVLGHIATIFPYDAIHIGGDECPTDAWSQCSDIPAFLAAKGLNSVSDIQPWLVNELGMWLKANYQKDVVCWNELTDHWKSEYKTRPIIMCYSDYGQNSMKKATDLGLRTIYTGCWPFYLDMYQTYDNNYNQATAHQFDEPYTGGYGNNTLQRAYGATPLSNIGGKESLCLGVGANLWTETVNNNREAEYQYFPRMLALAEVGWLPESQKNWTSFRKRVQTHFRVFDDMGVNYATYDLDQPELSALEEAQKEAQRLLNGAQPGAVGHPAAADVAALQSALASATDASTLNTAIGAYKNAAVCQPQAGKTYRIVSASVAWGRDYNGSTLYSSGSDLRFHYTPQTEPEELFTFSANADGSYNICTRIGGKAVTLATADAKAATATTGTPITIALARTASTAPAYYDYLPGVVTLSASDAMRLNAQNDGYAYAKADATVGHTGCWRIVEVTDWKAELQGLVDKCRRLDILDTRLVRPASALISGGSVGKEQYEEYLAVYLDAQNPEKIIPICVDREQTYTVTNGRRLNSFTVTTPTGGSKTFACNVSRVYNNLTIQRCLARPGESVAITLDYNGQNWMNSYVYIDRDHSWTLTPELGADHRPTAASELMSYSFFTGDDSATSDNPGYNSLGETLRDGARNVLIPPVFTLPADMEPGDYILRFKVDWNSIDPAGDTISQHGTFMTNGGAIADITLRVLDPTDLNADGCVTIVDVATGVDSMNNNDASVTLDGLGRIVTRVLDK